MVRACLICGRPLKTGRKYCWKHKGYVDEDSIRKPNYWRTQDFKPSNWTWFWAFFTALFGLLTIYSIFKLNPASFIFYGVLTAVSYLLVKRSKRRFKKLSREYAEDPEVYNEKRRYGLQYRLSKRMNKPLKARRTVNLGKPMKVSAQSGIDGMFR